MKSNLLLNAIIIFPFIGFSIVKNRTKGNLIHYGALPKTYDFNSSYLNKDSREYVLDGTHETPLEVSEYGNRLQFIPGLGVGCIYHLNKCMALGLEHKTVFTFRDDSDGFIPGGGRWLMKQSKGENGFMSLYWSSN